MTDTLDLAGFGAPVPCSWQVQLIKLPDGTMMVKQIVLTPAGAFVMFWSADDAQILASKLREGGRAAAAGTWLPDGAQGARRPVRTVAAQVPVSPPEGAERR